MSTNENDFFREVTLRICGSLVIDQALERVFEYVQQFIPVDVMGLGYSDLVEKKIRVVADVAREGIPNVWLEGAREIALPERILEDLRTQTDEEPVVVINQPEDLHLADWLAIFPGLTFGSALFLRLDIEGEEQGFLMVFAIGLNRYSPQHSNLLSTISEPCAIAMSNARRYYDLKQAKEMLVEDNRALSADIKRTVGMEVVGADFGLRDVMVQVRQIATSSSPTLLLGETGTGKEVIANAIHMASHRRKGPMVSMQCGAIPDTLLDSELFGHEKGAFTGASERKRGRFERADKGTLFLDEIGELSSEAQVKLLRVLQEKRFERVGGTKNIEVDVRVIAATHRDLEKMVAEGTFREDLWYRLNVLPIRIPPLRLRRQDIPSLVQYFVERKVQEMNLLHIPQIEKQSLQRLEEYDWPGNVRELQNVVERALILSRGDILEFPYFARAISSPPASKRHLADETMMTMDQVIRDHIVNVLKRTGGRVKGKNGAADILQMNPSTLRFRIKKLGIETGVMEK